MHFYSIINDSKGADFLSVPRLAPVLCYYFTNTHKIPEDICLVGFPASPSAPYFRRRRFISICRINLHPA